MQAFLTLPYFSHFFLPEELPFEDSFPELGLDEEEGLETLVGMLTEMVGFLPRCCFLEVLGELGLVWAVAFGSFEALLLMRSGVRLRVLSESENKILIGVPFCIKTLTMCRPGYMFCAIILLCFLHISKSIGLVTFQPNVL